MWSGSIVAIAVSGGKSGKSPTDLSRKNLIDFGGKACHPRLWAKFLSKHVVIQMF